jgi:hypothetical protein
MDLEIKPKCMWVWQAARPNIPRLSYALILRKCGSGRLPDPTSLGSASIVELIIN